jgi:CYTH domain-containing protein
VSMRDAAHEAASPKYARIESERRWLVDGATLPSLDGCAHVVIEDRYFEGTRLRLRKMTDSVTGAQSRKLTRKYDCADPLVRPIVTAYLTESEHALLAGLPGHDLIKRRYSVHRFSVDLFDGALAGLLLAEIEWPDDAGLRALSPPLWALREVSDDPRYQGGTLAVVGKPVE